MNELRIQTSGVWPLEVSSAARDVAARLTRWGIELVPYPDHWLCLRASAGVILGLRRGHSVTAEVYRHRDELWRLAVDVRMPSGAVPS